LGDEVDASLDQDLFRDFLEQLVIEFLTTPLPENPCGYLHSFAIELGKLSEGIFGINPDLDARIRELDKLCIEPDLSGLWRATPRSESETCERTVKPIVGDSCPDDCGGVQTDEFTESDSSGSFKFLINQVGSHFSISFPEAPGILFLIGSIQKTGDLSYPFHLRLTIPPGVSPECKTFFQTKGSFDFGDPICVPEGYNECEPVSCSSQERLFAKVSSDYRIEGVSLWTIQASVKEWLEGCCDFFTSISCSGSGLFKAVRD
jgi:hypothetical protein